MEQSNQPCLVSFMYCIVCGSNSRVNPTCSFFRFPRDAERCSQWKESIKLPNIMGFDSETCYNRYRVCSLHFEDTMFASMQKNKLKKDAYPKLHLERGPIEEIDEPHLESPAVSTVSLLAEPQPGTSKDTVEIFDNACPKLSQALMVTGGSVYNSSVLKPLTVSTVFVPGKPQLFTSNDMFQQCYDTKTSNSSTTLLVTGPSVYNDVPDLKPPPVSAVLITNKSQPVTFNDIFKKFHESETSKSSTFLPVTGDIVYNEEEEPESKPLPISTLFLPSKPQLVTPNDMFKNCHDSTSNSSISLPTAGSTVYSHVQTQTAAALEYHTPMTLKLKAKIKYLQRKIKKQTTSKESREDQQSDSTDDDSDIESLTPKTDLKNCCVKGCKTTYKNLTPNLRLFHFPRNTDRVRIWAENCDRKDVAALSLQYAYNHGVCSLHFENHMFVNSTKSRLKKTAVPTIFSNVPSENIEISENVTKSMFSEDPESPSTEIVIGEKKSQYRQNREEYRCRTCLNVVYRDTCINITQNCHSNKTVKEVILLLIPNMVSTLNDNQVVCNDCLKILESSMAFITKCLAIEEALQKEHVLSGVAQINSEHDYYRKSTVGDNEILEELSAVNNDEAAEDDFYDIQIRSHPQKKKKKRKKATPETRKEYTKTYSCTICPDTFTTREEYDLHLQIHPPHVCDVCGKAFAKSASLQSHKYSHNGRNYICEVCGKGYKDPSALRAHQDTHKVSDEKFECEQCKKVYNRKSRLRSHIRLIHRDQDGAQCPYCGLVLRRKATLLGHIKLRHSKGEETYDCKVCDKKFRRADYLRNHMSRHTNTVKPRSKKAQIIIPEKVDNRPVPCKLCGKWCGNIRKLRLHLYTHMNRFRCQFCPLTFARKCLCTRHEKVHEGGKNIFFRCNTCWKRFKTKEALDEHAVRHGNALYSCDLCEKTFNRRFLLYHHRRVDHDVYTDNEQAKEIIYESLLQVSKDSEQVN